MPFSLGPSFTLFFFLCFLFTLPIIQILPSPCSFISHHSIHSPHHFHCYDDCLCKVIYFHLSLVFLPPFFFLVLCFSFFAHLISHIVSIALHCFLLFLKTTFQIQRERLSISSPSLRESFDYSNN